MSAERNVRDAAARLASALDDARAAGLVVTWPGSPAGLRGIAISATAKAAPPAPPAPAAPARKPFTRSASKA